MPPARPRTMVLDTAALLAGLGPAQGPAGGDPHRPGGSAAAATRWVVPPAVRDEVRPGGPTGRAVERALAAGLVVQPPTAAGRAKVAEAVAGRGETGRLSEADLQVLAVAVDAQEGGAVEVWTDDYAIQNVARDLDIPTRPVMTRGIREEATWYVRCTGCGRYPQQAAADATCPTCGSPLKRTRRAPRR